MTPQRSAHRVFTALVWTLLLGGSLYAVDRLVHGAPEAGWRAAAELEAIPEEVGPVPVPRLLPETLGWPARVIRYRREPSPAWWLGIFARDATAEPAVWIGTGDPPPELGPLDACVVQVEGRRCPEPWRALSLAREGRTIHVVGRVPVAELRRILEGLRPR